MAQQLGFNSYDDAVKSPAGQALAGWNQGGILQAIQQGWGAMTPQEKTRAISALMGIGGLAGGLYAASQGQTGLGAGLGGLGALGLGYGVLGPSGTAPSQFQSMTPAQQKQISRMLPSDQQWGGMSRPQQADWMSQAAQQFGQRNELAQAAG